MPKKIEIKRVILSSDSNNLLTIQGYQDEEIPFENLTEKINEFIELKEPINIKIGKARLSDGVVRRPTFKYHCEKCGKKISSKEDGLHIECKDCGCEYIQE